MVDSTSSNTVIKPTGRTLAEFEPLFAAEKQLLAACRLGDTAMVGPVRPSECSEQTRVRGAFLRFLALGGDERAPVHEHGLSLSGAWIEGALDLVAATVGCKLSLLNCGFELAPALNDATLVGTLDLAGCSLPGLSADRTAIKGNVYLNQGFTASGQVRLLGAQIGGSLSCGAALVESFLADGVVVKGDVFLRDGFMANGEVRLLGAEIGGDLSCAGSQLQSPEGDALSADRVVVKGSVYLNEGFASFGRVRLIGAHVGGGLYCTGAQLDGQEGNALEADRVVITGSMYLNEGFSATGKVRLVAAQIGGSLSCRGAQLDGKTGDALWADGATIKGDVFLREGFTATGEVRLLGAEIGGDLSCTGAQLHSNGGDALSADGATIKGSVFLDEGFTAHGTVRLQGAQIGGGLYCTGALLDAKDGDAFSADGTVVQGSFLLRNMKQPVRGASLSGTRVGRLVDDAASWDRDLVLDGFVYDMIAGGAPTAASTRLAWLAKQRLTHYGRAKEGSDFRPQPWQQLISTLTAMGHVEEARQIAIALEVHLREIGKIGQTPPEWGRVRAGSYRAVSRWAHWVFGILIGYGHRPIRLIAWMVAVWLALGAFYWYAAEQAVFAPSNPLVFSNARYAHCSPEYVPDPEAKNAMPKFGNWFLCPELAGEFTTFSPLVYSLDLILPVMDLQQAHDWSPMIPTPKAIWYQELAHFSLNHVVRLLTWFENLFGWLGSLLLAAVVSGLTSREKE
jgi:hypothetical protein